MINKKGFTLVELVVSTTIIIILGTIGVIGYLNYSQGVNDSSKIAQLSMVNKALTQVNATGHIPKPDNFIKITNDNTILGYQGDIGEKMLKSLNIGMSDIFTNENNTFFYIHTGNRKYFQIGTLIQNKNAEENYLEITQVGASDFEKPYFLGKQIGTFFDIEGNILHKNTSFAEKNLNIDNLTEDVTLKLSDKSFVTGGTASFEKYEDLLKFGGKGCSTNGENINCMTYDDEREEGSGVGYTYVDGGAGVVIEDPDTGGGNSSTPGNGRITLDPLDYPSDIREMFRPSTSSDYNYFTDTWSSSSTCNPSNMDIVEYNPGDSIDTYISASEGNTVYVFNSGNYTISKAINTSTSARCVGFVGIGEPTIYLSKDQSSRWTTIQVRGGNMIVSGLNFNGGSNGSGVATQRGVYIKDVNNFTVSHITAQYHSQDGIRVYGNYGLVGNVTTHHNGEEGVQVGRDSSNQDATLVVIDKIITYNNDNNGVALINGAGLGVSNIETYGNSIAGISMETVSRGVISNIWTYNNAQHGLQVGNNLDVDNLRIDNIITFSNNSSGIYIDSTVNRVALNNIHAFDNTQTGIWTAGSDISINNSNIFNNNSYGLSIANQANGTLVKNIQFYKNQYGHLTAQGYNSRSGGNLYSTYSSCNYCELINATDVESQKYIQVNNSNWDYNNSGRNYITTPDTLSLSYGNMMNYQSQTMEYYRNTAFNYGTNGVDYFDTTDYIGIFQPVITQVNNK